MAVKYLVSGKDGDHLPYTKDDGSADHRLMGAAWAALHGGYRGNTYSGPNKSAALSKLKGLYKSEDMTTPQESLSVPAPEGSLLYEADGVTLKKDSFDSLRCRVSKAIDAALQSGADMDLDGDNDSGCYAWIMDLFPDCVIYSMNGGLYQCDYTDDGETVTLGTPVEVEQSYSVTPSDDSEAESETQESFRVMASAVAALEESAYDAATGKLTMTVIKPGFNKSKARYYPASMLKEHYKVFENAKMFLNHQSEKEAKERPEGNVQDYVAQITKVWPESDGTIKATAAVIDPPFKAKLAEMHKQGLLHEMGVSIRAIGEANEAEKDGVTTNVVESLIAARSVDFVTYPGAGGQLEAMESDKSNELDVDLVTEAVLRKRRPDLVALIETHSHQEITRMKSIEQQLSEAQAANAQLTKSNEELAKKFEEAQKASAKAAIEGELAKQLSEAKLPDAAKARIRKHFETAEKATAEQIKEAIISEVEYLKTVGAGKSSTPKNLGAADNGTTRESEDVKKPNMEEAFALLPGMSKEDAKHAATF